MRTTRARDARASALRLFFAVTAVAVCLALASTRVLATDANDAVVNLPPASPSNPSPADNSTNQGWNVTLQWQCSDPEGQAISYDVYLGTSNPPALFTTNVTSKNYMPPPRQFSTQYFWRIVARDALGAETSGPVWSFTTKTDSPPNVPVPVVPLPGWQNYPVAGELRFGASDPDQNPYISLVYDIYFGTEADPPLVSSGDPYTSFAPGTMQPNTLYRWRVVARDSDGAETSSPIWSFTTLSSASNVPPVTPNFPTPPHQNLLAPRNPVLKWNGGDPDGNPVMYSVTVWSDFPYEYYHEDTYVQQLAMSNLTKNVIYSWKVVATDGVVETYGPVWTFHVQGGMVPVLISSFDAKQVESGVRVTWSLASDEPMDGFALYRREGSNPPGMISEGEVVGDRGSYVDESAEPGKTYQYELVIRATDGDEFRSQTVAVTMRALTLTLHQNQPNPFNPQTTIRYELPDQAFVRLTIFDASGRRVRTLVSESQRVGSRSAIWNGRDDSNNAVSSGVYFYVLDAGKERLTRKLVLLK